MIQVSRRYFTLSTGQTLKSVPVLSIQPGYRFVQLAFPLKSASGIGGIVAGSLLGVWDTLQRSPWLDVPPHFLCHHGSCHVFYGSGAALVGAPLTAIMNSAVAKDMQGRVFSLCGSVVYAVMPLGLVALNAWSFSIALVARWQSG